MAVDGDWGRLSAVGAGLRACPHTHEHEQRRTVQCERSKVFAPWSCFPRAAQHHHLLGSS
jgi:hypothetical protein